MDCLRSSLTGNIVGLVSLLVGIAGLVITIKTMRSAKRIEEDIQKAKVRVLDTTRFYKDRQIFLQKLRTKRNAVLKNQVLSYTLCNNVLSIINDLRGYNNIITEADMLIIEQQRNALQQLSFSLQDGKPGCESIQEFDMIIASIMNILSKGDYDSL